MTVYNFRARNKEGNLIDSTMEADSEADVIAKLKARDYFVIEVNRNLAKQEINLNFGLFGKVKLRDLAVMTRQFSTLINSGMSLVESLDVLARQTSNEKLSKVLDEVRFNVESGLSLSESMAKHENIFSSMYISLVNAGEMGGALDVTLDRLAIFLEKENEMKLIANPVKLSRTPWMVKEPAPELGQHNKEVLSELGYSDEEIESFKEQGLIS